MLETEYIKSMNLNYERTKLSGVPEEKRYQYCIISRGGIGGMLGCSLRYINGDAFLYYDITSKQSLAQILFKKKVDREWMKDFAWNLKYIKQEASRFLLDDSNIIWFPEQVYQDLDENRWSFMYYPYYEGESGFNRFLEFVIEKLDYDDEKLVECAYKIYEQYEAYGEAYLKEKIYEDINSLDNPENAIKKGKTTSVSEQKERPDFGNAKETYTEVIDDLEESLDHEEPALKASEKQNVKPEKKGLFSFLESARKKDKDAREKIKRDNHLAVDYGDLPMVAEEESVYGDEAYDDEPPEEEYGRTVYMENVAEAKDEKHRLFDEKGAVLAVLGDSSLVIGKKKGEADIILENSTISRIHARITYEKEEYLLEDLNSTNGTFKNGLRLRPYERRKLTEGDEIRLGNVSLKYR
ncbi:MAG: FHA domain-containing protein [Lachnospiraceae bacterium]|nr:FHA domain-containing protein [Lachnospiraceae bacterium]